jgi:SAM-dependent methyltransferase
MEYALALREQVRAAYSQIADDPQNHPPFPTGRALAENLGYPPELLDTLPVVAVEAFCGVSNVPLFADIPAGATVLDLGCGAGLDTLIAAGRVGAAGQVIGVDFSAAMLARAGQATAEAGVSNVELRPGEAERLLLADDQVDIALVNGLFNLNPARRQIFCELARVVRPGGAVYAAEIVLNAPLREAEQQAASNWFA